ncbi:c-type cytochrome [Limobrevibacterium gyesilva]|uniref:Cytochrome c n=1 Tax=Limobrevibacterium gyesilva TaxID=2991712 RepID=A0AA41YKC1_9PROT|nr:cytochrome c [Limobrevibacterium gyesilva]
MQLLSAILLTAFARPSACQETGDVAAGRRLAEASCSTCHIIGPTPQRVGNDVPTFAAIARMPSTTPLALRAFLQTPHSRMPNLILKPGEIDDLIAYILSLRHA